MVIQSRALGIMGKTQTLTSTLENPNSTTPTLKNAQHRRTTLTGQDLAVHLDL